MNPELQTLCLNRETLALPLENSKTQNIEVPPSNTQKARRGDIAVVSAPIANSISYMGVSENGGPKYSTLNSRILITRTPT